MSATEKPEAPPPSTDKKCARCGWPYSLHFGKDKLCEVLDTSSERFTPIEADAGSVLAGLIAAVWSNWSRRLPAVAEENLRKAFAAGEASMREQIALDIEKHGAGLGLATHVRDFGKSECTCGSLGCLRGAARRQAQAHDEAELLLHDLPAQTSEQSKYNAYDRWKLGSRANDPERKAAFERGCFCHYLTGDFHHTVLCPGEKP